MNVSLDVSEVHLLKRLLQNAIEQGSMQYTQEGYENILKKLQKENKTDDKSNLFIK